MSKILRTLFKKEKWDVITETLLLIYIAECTFGGSGRWLEIGPLSIRMIIFVLCFFATLPNVFRNIKKLACNLQVIATVCFAIYLAVCAVIGIATGNQLSFVVADVTTFMALALLPGFLATMCNERSINKAINVIFWAAVSLSVIGIVLHFLDSFANEGVIAAISRWLNERSLGGIAAMQTGIHRIYMRSQIFIQVAIIYGVWKIGKNDCKNKLLIGVSLGVLFCGCILTYTRGFWLGLAASAGMLLLVGFKYWGKFLKVAGGIIAVFAAFVLVSSACYRGFYVPIEIVNRFDPNLIATDEFSDGSPMDDDLSEDETDDDSDTELDKVGEANAVSRDLRTRTLQLLKERIADNPIIGNGLGENLDEIRNDGKTEYMYLDIIMKTGIIGFILFLLNFFGCVLLQIYYSFRRKRIDPAPVKWEDAEIRNRFLTAAYLGVAVTSFFNPFINNPMGITILMLTVTAIYNGKPKDSKS